MASYAWKFAAVAILLVGTAACHNDTMNHGNNSTDTMDHTNNVGADETDNNMSAPATNANAPATNAAAPADNGVATNQ